MIAQVARFNNVGGDQVEQLVRSLKQFKEQHASGESGLKQIFMLRNSNLNSLTVVALFENAESLAALEKHSETLRLQTATKSLLSAEPELYEAVVDQL
jgi:hypothetical protein